MSPRLPFLPQDGEPTEGLVATSTLDPQSGVFEGHFPGQPVLPALRLLLDLVVHPAAARWPELGAPRGLARVKFRRMLRPHDALGVTLERPRPGVVAFRIERAGEEVASGQVQYGTSP